MVIATLFILLFGLMLVGVPVAVALGASTLVSAFLFTNNDLMGISSYIFDGLNKYTLMAIPMFVLAGSLLSRGSAATRIINFAKSLLHYRDFFTHGNFATCTTLNIWRSCHVISMHMCFKNPFNR